MSHARSVYEYFRKYDLPEKPKIEKRWIRYDEAVVRYGVTRNTIIRWKRDIEKQLNKKITLKSDDIVLINSDYIEEFLESKKCNSARDC